MLILQALISGLSLGSFYALVALGFALIFGITHAFNLAHGELIIVCGYLGYFLWKAAGWPFIAILPLCLLAGAVAAGGLRLLVQRLPEPLELNSLLVTFGLGLLLQNVLLALFSADYRLISGGTLNVLAGLTNLVVLTGDQAALLGFSLAATALVHLLLRHTVLGQALRATIQDREAALLAGINVQRLGFIAFLLGGLLIGLAGPLFARTLYLHPAGGLEATLIAVTITIFAGVGRTRGVLWGGWLLGVAESLAAYSIGASWRELISAGVLIALLVFRPQGLFARKTPVLL